MVLETRKQICRCIVSEKESLAELILKLQHEMQPDLSELFGACGYDRHKQDTICHILYLAETVGYNELILFTEYINWAKTLRTSAGLGIKDLQINLHCMKTAIDQRFSEYDTSIFDEFICAALARLQNNISETTSYIRDEFPYSELAGKYLRYVLNGDKQKAIDLVFNAVNSGVSIEDIYLNLFQRTQYEIGRLWQLGRISVAQEHYCTALAQFIIAQLYPYVFDKSIKMRGLKFLGTCMPNELHEIGIRMVADFLERAGWNAYYLGANVPVSSVLGAIEQFSPDIIGISIATAINISNVENLINEINKKFGGNKPKVIAGGVPFNISNSLWRNVGADGYSKDARDAVLICEELVKKDRI